MLVILAACAQYVTVTVTNATQQPVRDVQVRYTGGSIDIPDLPPNATRTVRIRPSGESSLTVRYVDAIGTERSKDGDVYLERDYSGTIAIEIRPNDVVVSSNARP